MIYTECNLHLIYLGQDMYGEVIPLLDLPKTLQSFEAGMIQQETTLEVNADATGEASNMDNSNATDQSRQFPSTEDFNSVLDNPASKNDPNVNNIVIPPLPIIGLPLHLLVVDFL